MSRRVRSILILSFATLFSGCVAYSLVEPGPTTVGDLRINASVAWNQAPTAMTPAARSGTKVWTRDGLLLDRIVIIPGVPDGEPIFKPAAKSQALPAFKADMLPNELEELTESSIVKLFGEGETAVTTINLRPHQFGENAGILFDVEAQISDGPDYRGIVGAFIYDAKLYIMIYVAAEPFYYDKHREEAEAIIKSARI
jgi:hypothetical protein